MHAPYGFWTAPWANGLPLEPLKMLSVGGFCSEPVFCYYEEFVYHMIRYMRLTFIVPRKVTLM